MIMWKTFKWIYLPIMGIIALGFFGYGAYLGFKCSMSQSWPSVQGQIVKSEIIESKTGPDSATVDIDFAYSVEGKLYRSDQYQFGAKGQYRGFKYARELVAKYPVGSDVTVYYSSHNPTSAVLEKANAAFAYLFMFLGAMFGMMGFALYFVIRFILTRLGPKLTW